MKKKIEISPLHLLNSKKKMQNSSLPLVQAGCLEIEERRKYFYLVLQIRTLREVKESSCSWDGLTRCLWLFQSPDKTLEMPI